MGYNPDLSFQYDPDVPVKWSGEWTPYIGSPPPERALVVFWNEYSGEKWVGRRVDLRPEFNVARLWWKLTGLERMKNNS